MAKSRTEINRSYYLLNREEILLKRKMLREEFRESLRERYRIWRLSNPEKSSKASSSWKEKHRERVKEYNREYSSKNMPKMVDKANKRVFAKTKQTPLWADKNQILMWYEVANVLSRSGVKFHVDHIVPLKSDKVCGFHTHDNLQVLPWYVNISKKNKFNQEVVYG